MTDNTTIDDNFFTAQELLKHGYSFAELMRLAEQNVIRRRHRVNYKGDDVFTFSERDLVNYRNETEATDGDH